MRSGADPRRRIRRRSVVLQYGIALMPPRTVALIGAVCLTTGWLLASVLTPPVARVQALPERAATPAPAAISLPPVERLQFRLSEAPPPPTPRRNPFEFGGRERVSTVPDVDAAPARPVMDAVAAPAIVGRQYSLAGIGTTTGPEGAGPHRRRVRWHRGAPGQARGCRRRLHGRRGDRGHDHAGRCRRCPPRPAPEALRPAHRRRAVAVTPGPPTPSGWQGRRESRRAPASTTRGRRHRRR